MLKEKSINCYSYKTLPIKKFCNRKLTYLTEVMRLVKPALEDIKTGNYMTMEEFGAWLDELSNNYE